MTDLNPGLVRMARIYQDTWMAVVTSIGSFEGRASLKATGIERTAKVRAQIGVDDIGFVVRRR